MAIDEFVDICRDHVGGFLFDVHVVNHNLTNLTFEEFQKLFLEYLKTHGVIK